MPIFLLDLLEFLPAAVMGLAVPALYKFVITKLRARADLAKAVERSGRAELAELHAYLEKNDLSGAAEVLRRHLNELPKAEQREAEAAIGQPSPSGRENYVRE